MAMRELVTGGAACSVPGSSSGANPLGALANVLIGSSSKSQERLKEIPTSTSTFPSSQIDSLQNEQLTSLPGSESDYQQSQHAGGQGAAFLDSFHATSGGRLADAWEEIQHPPSGYYQQGGQANFVPGQFNNRLTAQPQLALEGPPQKILSSFLHSFVHSSGGGFPFLPTALPVLGLTKGDKQCIRDRSSIMARHFFVDKSDEFINVQVDALLSSLDIDNLQGKAFLPGKHSELEDYWNESQGKFAALPPADGWVSEFGQYRQEPANPDMWAQSFEQQHGHGSWASEFEHEQDQATSFNQFKGVPISNLAAMEQSRMLADTLAQNNDPKFQNSKFLQFVSKMSRCELFIEDNQVQPTTVGAAGDWAAEYENQYQNHLLPTDHVHKKLADQPESWIREFAGGKQETAEDQWVDEFSKLHMQDWADEFGNQLGSAIRDDTSDGWASAYDEAFVLSTVAKPVYNGPGGVGSCHNWSLVCQCKSTHQRFGLHL